MPRRVPAGAVPEREAVPYGKSFRTGVPEALRAVCKCAVCKCVVRKSAVRKSAVCGRSCGAADQNSVTTGLPSIQLSMLITSVFQFWKPGLRIGSPFEGW